MRPEDSLEHTLVFFISAPIFVILRPTDGRSVPDRAGNFKARTIFFDFQNAGRQDARWESITGDDSLTEYNTQFVC